MRSRRWWAARPDDMSRTSFDIVIAGGGLVGGSLAIALAGSGLRIALVEAFPPDSAAQPSFDDRTLALARGSCKALEQLGVWTGIQDDVWPIRQIHVSQQGRFGTALIDAAEQGIGQLGYVIKSRSLGQAIWRQIETLEDLTVFCPARVTATQADASARVVTLEREKTTVDLSTQLLVVADGARSQLRTALGISATERDYEQVAVVVNAQFESRGAGYRAFERFTSEGPLAVLPVAEGRYTVVLARNADSVQSVMAMPDEELQDLLQSLFGYRLGRIVQLGRRQSYPLSLVTAQAISAPRAVVIGNAANGLHPVAAQGFNLGLRDVACLAETLVDAARAAGAEFDAGSAGLVDDYVAWRESDQRQVVQFTDGLIRLFGMPGELAGHARGAGLAAFDVLPGAKQELARQTMGLAGRMSRLARGLPL